MSEGLAECEWISGVLESAVYQDYEPSLHRRKSISSAVEPTVTVMKADSHLQIDPSTVCVIDAKSAFDHLVRESTGGHCRRTAQELCVIRRSMLTLRARCRWVPHERMVVDALMKRHGNGVTMLRLMRDGVLSVVDEDGELAMIPQSDVTVKTESQSPLKEDPTQGWKQQGDWRQPQRARGYDRAKSKSTSQIASGCLRGPSLLDALAPPRSQIASEWRSTTNLPNELRHVSHDWVLFDRGLE